MCLMWFKKEKVINHKRHKKEHMDSRNVIQCHLIKKYNPKITG
jgi:hypothetical protein